MGIFPNFRGEHAKYLKSAPSDVYQHRSLISMLLTAGVPDGGSTGHEQFPKKS